MLQFWSLSHRRDTYGLVTAIIIRRTTWKRISPEMALQVVAVTGIPALSGLWALVGFFFLQFLPAKMQKTAKVVWPNWRVFGFGREKHTGPVCPSRLSLIPEEQW